MQAQLQQIGQICWDDLKEANLVLFQRRILILVDLLYAGAIGFIAADVDGFHHPYNR
jgi:hypothetical protein